MPIDTNLIATITLNPSIDKRYTVTTLEKGKVIRTSKVINTAGGKGLNVSRVLKDMGSNVLATGFLGDHNGRFIEEILKRCNIKCEFQWIKDSTRCCIAILDDEGNQTEILEPGPFVLNEEICKFLKVYNDILDKVNILVISGSLPKGLDKEFYKTLINLAKEKEKIVLLDSSGQGLKEAIKSKPYFIKPNIEELEALTNKSLKSDFEIIREIDKLHGEGIELIIISLGKDGAIGSLNGEKYKITPPKVNVINAVGSGDSMVAAVAYALSKSMNLVDLLTIAVSTGTANTMEEVTGHINMDNLKDIIKNVTVKRFD